MIKYKNIEEVFKGMVSIEPISKNKYEVLFPMYDTKGKRYHIYLITEKDKWYLTDNGVTYSEIGILYDLQHEVTISTFVKVLKNFGIRKNKSNAFTIECTPDDIHQKYSSLLQCVSFMRNISAVYS